MKRLLYIFCFFIMPLEAQILTRDFATGEDLYYKGSNYRVVKMSHPDDYYNLIWKSWTVDDIHINDLPHLLDMKTQKQQSGDGYFINPVVDSIYFNHAGAMQVCPAGWRLPRIGEWDTLLRKLNHTQRDWLLSQHNGFKGYHSAIEDSTIVKKTQILNGGFWWAADTLGNRAYVIKLTNDTWDIGLADIWDYATVRCVKDEE
jgi:uncharacterized protein (TIGR02145 family)